VQQFPVLFDVWDHWSRNGWRTTAADLGVLRPRAALDRVPLSATQAWRFMLGSEYVLHLWDPLFDRLRTRVRRRRRVAARRSRVLMMMNRAAERCAFAFGMALALLAACGGDVSGAPNGARGSDTALDATVNVAASDATRDVPLYDVAGDPSCPLALPVAGQACASSGLDCEYGSDPELDCDTLMRCSNGAWMTAQTPLPGVCATVNPALCAEQYGDITPMQACPAEMDCYYSEARCYCGCGGELFSLCESNNPSPALYWGCDTPSTATPSCPVPRPRVGSACSQLSPGPTCDYGACIGGIALVCANHRWQQPIPSCPP
jgi:hypothetical protein